MCTSLSLKVLRKTLFLICRSCAIKKLPSIVLIAFLLAFGCYGSVFSAEEDMEKYREMCETGSDGKACFELGYAYLLGRTGKVDYEKAYKYLKKSCKLDYGAGCYLLGFMYKKGYGYATEEDVIKGWLDSPGHCANIMNPDFTEMGVATSGKYWTQIFATPKQ